MRHRIDERLLREMEQHQFDHTCERCGHFDDPSGSCSLGFPTELHRARPLTLGGDLTFCKTFEPCG